MVENSGIKERKEFVKELIKRLHAGEDPEKIKEEFKEFLGDVNPTEIARVEQELIKEGMPREEIQRLCDVHIAIFKESLEKAKTIAPQGHPVNILMEEHKKVLEFAGELKKVAGTVKEAGDFSDETIHHLNHIVKHLKDSESHYLREENVLFPYLEKHGITEPPAIMWIEHDKIRKIKKDIYKLVDERTKLTFNDFVKQLGEMAVVLAEMLSDHFYKENNVLFPTALNVIEKDEWTDVRKQFDEIGYCCFTPEPAKMVTEEVRTLTQEPKEEGVIKFETGTFSMDELEALLDTLPVDVTFIDKNDRVRYFSQSKDRIFVRAKAVIGRKVQKCHPQKSVHVVEKILNSFKNRKKDVAAFWINLNDRLILIRYFAVRNKDREYLGCLEVTQDITDIRKIEGERRLLDWKD